MKGFYSIEELRALGISKIGENVYISQKCSIYGAHNIELGNNVRIDDFCILACVNGPLQLDGYNHVGCYSYINSAGGVHMKMFSGLSSRCSLYSSSQNYDGSCLTNPTVPSEFVQINCAPINIGKHAVVGTNTVILPGCNIGDYAAVGACSLVNRSIADNRMAKGIPAKEYRDRNIENLQKLEFTFTQG